MNNKQRLDQALVSRGLVTSRSQGESFIRLGKVTVNGRVAHKPGVIVDNRDELRLTAEEQYVSRAGLKLASVAQVLQLDFRSRVMLDVGSSTGGFTDYALRHGAKKVIAVDVGTNQLHPSLRGDARIELHEQTDIRTVGLSSAALEGKKQGMSKRAADNYVVLLATIPDIVVIDVSFVSLREILPSVAALSSAKTQIVAMCKPQFEVYAEPSRSTREPSASLGLRGSRSVKHKGVIKNDHMRRDILKEFEAWLREHGFAVRAKADSQVAGSKGNVERFYLLTATD
jgi:23S rRNA (cytidine1920-2'-O)/16S rRNA (cytidine1409-2'-O)-methyltransferase